MEVVYIDDPYFNWLCSIIGACPNYNGVSYYMLCHTLHDINYSRNTNDKNYNRAFDGLMLRSRFIKMTQNDNYGSASNRGPCTVFELLVALSEQMDFIISERNDTSYVPNCFFLLIKNLGIIKYNDEYFDQHNGEFYVSDAANRLVMDICDYDGKGGLFPLRHPKSSQHDKDIWYQMHAWILENYKF